MSSSSGGNPWSDYLRNSQMRSSPQRGSSRMNLGSTGASVPIQVQSPNLSSSSSSPAQHQPQETTQQNYTQLSHPYRMPAQVYTDLSRSRSNSVQSVPRDELSDSSFGSSPPSGRVTPTPGLRWNAASGTFSSNASPSNKSLPPAVPRHPSQEAYAPDSQMAGFRVSMNPSSSAPSRRDTWASSLSGSHHGHANSSPPPPVPQLPLPGEPSPFFPSSYAHEQQNAQAPDFTTSPKLELPSLKLDLDLGPSSLFDDVSFSSLGFGSIDTSASAAQDSLALAATPTLPAATLQAPSTSPSVSTHSFGESTNERSWIDPGSSPSTIIGVLDPLSSSNGDLSKETASSPTQDPYAESDTSLRAGSVMSHSSPRLSNLDMNSSIDSLSPGPALPPGAAKVPSRNVSGDASSLHSQTGSDEHHVRLPPPRASSRQATIPISNEHHVAAAAHDRKSSKGSRESSLLSQTRSLSKSSLQSPVSPTYRSSESHKQSSSPETTPDSTTSRPTSGQTLQRAPSHLALNKKLPPPPQVQPAPTTQPLAQIPTSSSASSGSSQSHSLGRHLFRRPSGPRQLELVQVPDDADLPPRPNTAPHHQPTMLQKKSSLSSSTSAANQILARSKELLHRSVPSGSSSLHEGASQPSTEADELATEKPARSTRSSLASYFTTSPPHTIGRQPIPSISSSLVAEQRQSLPARQSLPRFDSNDSISSDEFGAAQIISMSTAKRDVERKVEQQKELQERERAKEMQFKDKRVVSSKPPPPVDLEESAKRPSTQQLLELVSAKLFAFVKSQTPSESGGSDTGSRRSSISNLSADLSEEAELSTAQVARISRPGLLQEVSEAEGQIASVPDVKDVPVPQLSSPPKAVERRAALAEAEKMLSGKSNDPPPTSNRQQEQKRPATLELTSHGDAAAALVSSPLKSAPPKTPAPPPLLWEKRVLPVASEADPSGWVVLEESYEQYFDALETGQQDRHAIVQASLLHFLKQVELGQQCLSSDPAEAKKQREVLFKWMDLLAEELKGVPANRGTCLDGVAATLESVCFSPEALAGDDEGRARFHSSLVAILSFAVEKLNEKAVYANTLSFSGRLFAVAFFRIEGVGQKLLRLLPPVKRQDLKRIMTECGVGAFVGRTCPPLRMDIFPEHLRDLCFQGLQSYSTLLTPLAPSEDAMLVETDLHCVRMHGNWLIRWQASDSDLPFAFYRAYHRQLSAYLQPPASMQDQGEAFVSPYEALSAPGFLYIAASLLEKVDSLIHRNLRSVTTLGPNNNNFSSSDSANLSMGSKPKVLEHLNRRVVTTIQDIVGGPARPQPDPEARTYEGLWRRRYFGGMLQVWLRALVKKTSLYDARGVFLLFDFIEGLFYTVCTQVPAPGTEPGPWHPSQEALILFDVPFILNFTKTILNKADNTIELMRTITFLYSQFETFTLRPADRHELCQKILLYPETFQRLFLFWNVSVRGYFLRLLVWRISRLGTSPDGRPMDIKDAQIIGILQTLNSRLEGIRKRHDEIDPLSDLPDDGLFDATRASVSSTRGVTNQSWFSEELVEGRRFSFSEYESDSDSDLSDDNTLYTPNHEKQNSTEKSSPGSNGGAMSRAQLKDHVKITKAVNWLKMLKPPKRLSGRGKDAQPEAYGSVLERRSESAPELTESSSESNQEDVPPATPKKENNSQPASALSEQEDQQEPFPIVGNLAANDNNFFKFEFESSTPVSDAFERRSRRSTKAASIKTNRTSRTSRTSIHNGRSTPSRRASLSQSPRVSKRFSKRASILPPPALDLLLESSEPVPQIPKEFQNPPPYTMTEHPYAVRSLREYEDALDEFDVWIARVQEDDEELEGREHNELIPRLSLLWPLSFSESD